MNPAIVLDLARAMGALGGPLPAAFRPVAWAEVLAHLTYDDPPHFTFLEPPHPIYFTGTSTRDTAAYPGRDLCLMLQPGNSLHLQASHYPHVAIDNGCFTAGPDFDPDEWLGWLACLLEEHPAVKARALFAVAPDVLCDAAATIAASALYLPFIRGMGIPAAFVAQNGLTSASAPWDAFDVLFLGGDTAWKLGPEAKSLAAEARRRGKWVHMGRVNSWKRFRTACLHHCDSVDGTFLKHGPEKNWPRLHSWLRRNRALAFTARNILSPSGIPLPESHFNYGHLRLAR